MTLSFLTKYKIYLRYNIAYSILSAFFYKKNLFINKINNTVNSNTVNNNICSISIVYVYNFKSID